MEMEHFNNSQEAESAIKLFKDNWTPPFCPVINSLCKDNCICFRDAYIFMHSKKDYMAYPQSCSNVSLFGE